MNILCKRVHLLDRDPDNGPDCDPDNNPHNFATYYGVIEPGMLEFRNLVLNNLMT